MFHQSLFTSYKMTWYWRNTVRVSLIRRPTLFELGGELFYIRAYTVQEGRWVFKYFIFLSRWTFGASVLDYVLLPHSHFTSLPIYFSLSFLYFSLSSYTLFFSYRKSLENYPHFSQINPLNAELNPICYLLALLAHHFLHVSRIRVTSLTLRLLTSYIYIYTYIYIYNIRSLRVN